MCKKYTTKKGIVMDYESHLENRDHIIAMAGDDEADAPQRLKILDQRQTTIAAQWSKVSYRLRQYQRRQIKTLHDDPYRFWTLSSKHRMVLMAVMDAHFTASKLSAEKVGKDLGYSRGAVAKLLKEAQDKGLLVEEGGCHYKPSLDTVDGFIFYTNETMGMDEMLKLSAGVIRLKIGAFQQDTEQVHNKNRKKCAF